MPPNDRRRYARVPISQPVKVQCQHSGRYYSGRTSNLSAGGALLTVESPTRLPAGHKLRLGIAWSRQEAVLASAALVEATVTRNLIGANPQLLAIQFAQIQPALAQGTLPAA